MSREDQGKVNVKIMINEQTPWPGLGDLGDWENRTGGEGGTDSVKHREGGMGPLKSYGGPPTQEKVTVARRYDFSRDHSKIKALYAARGRALMIVTETPLDEYGVAFGDPTVYKGKLDSVNPGDVNANSNNIRMITLVQDTDNIS